MNAQMNQGSAVIGGAPKEHRYLAGVNSLNMQAEAMHEQISRLEGLLTPVSVAGENSLAKDAQPVGEETVLMNHLMQPVRSFRTVSERLENLIQSIRI
jgi:hypothetical protein